MRRVSGVVVDTSIWIDFLNGLPVPSLEEALEQGSVIASPVVIAEIISGASRPKDRQLIEQLVTELEMHPTPLDHWIRVGDLRRVMLQRGVSVSIPDAHVAQCALDRDALLLSRDGIFAKIAAATTLKVRDS